MLNTISNHNNLSYTEYEKYAKQIIIEEIKAKGQNRLKSAKIICIGAGGLNAPVLMYLTACGIGTIGIVDHDSVELSNLQRQVIYNRKDIKNKKVRAAHINLSLLNQSVTIKNHIAKLTKDNIVNILSGYEIVIDGTDDFATRYLISQYCYKLHKIHIYGAIDKFMGQVSVFNYQNHGNYHNLHKKISYNKFQKCNTVGVVNTLAGIIGLLQATEAIKIIVGIGQISCSQLVVFDLLNCSLNKTKIRSCKLMNQEIIKQKYKNTKFQEKYISAEIILKDKKQSYALIDIRTSIEFQAWRLDKAISMPLNTLKRHLSIKEIKKLTEAYHVVLYCNNSTRSYVASQILERYSIKHYIFDNRTNEGKRGIRTLVK